MRRAITLLMAMILTLVSGTSYAAAICHHRNAQAHAAARASADARVAADAHGEEAAAAAASHGAIVDASAFSLPAFILPAADDVAAVPVRDAETAPERGKVTLRRLAWPPPLEPPAA